MEAITPAPRSPQNWIDVTSAQFCANPSRSEKQSHFYEAEKIGGAYFRKGGTPAGAAADDLKKISQGDKRKKRRGVFLRKSPKADKSPRSSTRLQN